MSKAEKTKHFIIEKTASLFNRKGYVSTSLSDIAEATGLTKGSIYGNFENKDQLALEAYRYNAGSLKADLISAFDSFPTAVDKLYAFVALYRKNWHVVFSSGGCPLMNAATEADDTFPDLRDQVKNSFEEWMAKISEVITHGQKTGELNKKPDAEEYASLFIMMIEGGILLSKTTGDEKFLNLVLDRILKIINTELAAGSSEE